MIQKLKQIYPSYSVVATGHSYGAATSQLLAMELVKAQIYVQIYNYGQPRIGDANYAAFVNTKIWNYLTSHGIILKVYTADYAIEMKTIINSASLPSISLSIHAFICHLYACFYHF